MTNQPPESEASVTEETTAMTDNKQATHVELNHEFPDADVQRLVADAKKLNDMNTALVQFRARLIVDLQHAMMRIQMDLNQLSVIAFDRAIEAAKAGDDDAAGKLTSAAEEAREASRREIPRA